MSAPMLKIERVAVIGAGTMGNGIAQVCAAAGFHVAMLDVSPEAIARGMATIAANLERLVTREKLTVGERDQTYARIKGITEYPDLSDTQLVIESATESPELKLRILRQVEDVVSVDALIASNTSSISITQMAAVLRKPERFIGLHFFNPVPLMPLVELIRGLQTNDITHAQTLAFALAIGKSPVNARNSAGFVVNRILCPMINEAILVLQEGLSTAEDIDAAMKLGCSHPIGPLALADLVGLDTLLAIMEVLRDSFGDPKYRPAPLLREFVQAGRLGRKSGRGFFQY
jgi:3-hydroxybutyryl-CoA dehydrogenase